MEIVHREDGVITRSAEARRWMDFVRNIPAIDDDEGLELARRFQDGDEQAGERLVAAHLYVVLQVAQRLRVRTDHALDLIQEGNAGILDALHRFDPERGVPFSAYARYWARARMLAYVSTHRRLVQPGRPTRDLLRRVIRERERRQARGEPVDDVALAEALEVSVASVRRALDTVPKTTEAYDGEAALVFLPGGRDPEAEVASREVSSKVSDAVASFVDTLRDEREEVIFFERITSDEPVSLSELGRRFGVSRERARQLEARILPRFREHLEREVGMVA